MMINQIELCAAIAHELSRQCPTLTAEQANLPAVIAAAKSVCDALNPSFEVAKPEVLTRKAAKALFYRAMTDWEAAGEPTPHLWSPILEQYVVQGTDTSPTLHQIMQVNWGIESAPCIVKRS